MINHEPDFHRTEEPDFALEILRDADYKSAVEAVVANLGAASNVSGILRTLTHPKVDQVAIVTLYNLRLGPALTYRKKFIADLLYTGKKLCELGFTTEGYFLIFDVAFEMFGIEGIEARALFVLVNFFKAEHLKRSLTEKQRQKLDAYFSYERTELIFPTPNQELYTAFRQRVQETLRSRKTAKTEATYQLPVHRIQPIYALISVAISLAVLSVVVQISVDDEPNENMPRSDNPPSKFLPAAPRKSLSRRICEVIVADGMRRGRPTEHAFSAGDKEYTVSCPMAEGGKVALELSMSEIADAAVASGISNCLDEDLDDVPDVCGSAALMPNGADASGFCINDACLIERSASFTRFALDRAFHDALEAVGREMKIK